MQTTIEWFSQLPPIWQALIATGFIWGVTALGAALVGYAALTGFAVMMRLDVALG